MSETAKINDLIFICNIIDEYDNFSNDLNKLITTKDIDKILKDFNKLHNGIRWFISKDIRSFYFKYKDLIEYIFKYMGEDFFIKNNLDYFYKYINKHKIYKSKILQLLDVLKMLGFEELTLKEETKFTDEEYSTTSSYNKKINIVYLDNIEIIPNYQNNLIKYKSKGSNYKITIKNSRVNITVNSLIFDITKLPNSIDPKFILNEIISLKKISQKSCDELKNAINMNYYIDVLETKISFFIKDFEGEKKEEFSDFRIKLNDMKQKLNELKALKREYIESLPEPVKMQVDSEYLEYQSFTF